MLCQHWKGKTKVFEAEPDMLLRHLVEGSLVGKDPCYVTHNCKILDLGSVVHAYTVQHNDTIRICGRLRGGAFRARQQQPNMLGQWTCPNCAQERVWPTIKCFRCGCPKPVVIPPRELIQGPNGRLPRRSTPVNPTFRPQKAQNNFQRDPRDPPPPDHPPTHPTISRRPHHPPPDLQEKEASPSGPWCPHGPDFGGASYGALGRGF